MFIRINNLLRNGNRVLVLSAAFAVVFALVATHGALSTAHMSEGPGQTHGDGMAVHGDHMSDNGDGQSDGMQIVMSICLAVVEAAVAIVLGLALVRLRDLFSGRARSTARPVAASSRFAVPALAGLGPPGRRAALLQVFLR
ncbi:MAG: hypothetical protein HY827_00095 [Actinobacteria bacterium]|nr:hypothetical protein [Actinomycetota bacterium]